MIRALVFCVVTLLWLGIAFPLQAAQRIYREDWAILIGINRYQHAPPLNYAVADVEGMKKLLVAKFGFRPDRVFTLIDAQATRDNILKLFGSLDRTGEHDRVIIFFAGHGTQIDLPTGGEMGFLIPVDGKVASRSDLFATSISMQMVRDLSPYVPAKHILFLVDACYGGLAAVTNRSLPKETARYIEKVTTAKARQILTAGGKGEVVMERAEWGHSAFTYKLLEGLGKGLADVDGDGIVTASELSSWLKSNVAAATGSRQLPQFKAFTEDEGDMVFVLAGRDPSGARPIPQEPRGTTSGSSPPAPSTVPITPPSPLPSPAPRDPPPPPAPRQSVPIEPRPSQPELPPPLVSPPAPPVQPLEEPEPPAKKKVPMIVGKHLIRFQFLSLENVPLRKPDGGAWRGGGLLGPSLPPCPYAAVHFKEDRFRTDRVCPPDKVQTVGSRFDLNRSIEMIMDPIFDEVTLRLMNRHDSFFGLQAMEDDEMGSITFERRKLTAGKHTLRLDSGILLTVEITPIRKIGPGE